MLSKHSSLLTTYASTQPTNYFPYLTHACRIHSPLTPYGRWASQHSNHQPFGSQQTKPHGALGQALAAATAKITTDRYTRSTATRYTQAIANARAPLAKPRSQHPYATARGLSELRGDAQTDGAPHSRCPAGPHKSPLKGPSAEGGAPGAYIQGVLNIFAPRPAMATQKILGNNFQLNLSSSSIWTSTHDPFSAPSIFFMTLELQNFRENISTSYTDPTLILIIFG